MTSSPASAAPRWQVVALQLQALIDGPTAEQISAAKALGLTLLDHLPAPVAAVVLRRHLGDAIGERLTFGAEVPESLTDLENDVGVTVTSSLVTESREEVSAWFAARYMLKTVRGLNAVKPEVGDIVLSDGWPGERRVISSIGDSGRVYMKGRPGRRAWPTISRSSNVSARQDMPPPQSRSMLSFATTPGTATPVSPGLTGWPIRPAIPCART